MTAFLRGETMLAGVGVAGTKSLNSFPSSIFGGCPLKYASLVPYETVLSP